MDKKDKEIDNQVLTLNGWTYRFYVSRKEEKANIEDCVDAAVQEFEKYTNKNKERLVTVDTKDNINQKIYG